jgi:hypothetical protein
VEKVFERAVTYEHVPIEKLTAFIALRARSEEPSLEKTRLLLAKLKQVDQSALDRRDELIRQVIMQEADPAAVLNALVRGLEYFQTGRGSQEHSRGGSSPSLQQLLRETSLERLLQAVAVDRGLIAEMRLLLCSIPGTPLKQLCDDLEDVVGRVYAEADL